MITEEIANQICKLILSEHERLTGIAQKENPPDNNGEYPLEIAGYIVGSSQLSTNIQSMIRDLINYDGEICWKCGYLLETKPGKDYAGEEVPICCQCEAVIRN